jgi:hypothetical protein
MRLEIGTFNDAAACRNSVYRAGSPLFFLSLRPANR